MAARIRPATRAAGLVALAALALVAAPSAAAVAASADVDDFEFSVYDADFTLGLDADGRATLHSVERFTAVFPDFDQNHGMVRAFPLDFDGHPVDLALRSLTDETGAARPVETEEDGDYLYVTSREDPFVHGEQTYVFTTEARNVVRFPDDSRFDEFVWDTNGSEARQPVRSLTARVHVPAELADRFSGDVNCFVGDFGSTTPCPSTIEEGADGETVVAFSAADLAPFENVTVAVAFERGTFVPRDDGYFATGFGVAQLVGLGIALLGLLWSVLARLGPGRDGRGHPTIVAQYEPPPGVEPYSGAMLLRVPKTAIGAQLLAFAVARMIDIAEGETTGVFRRRTDHVVTITGTGTDDPERARLWTSLIGGKPAGTSFPLRTTTWFATAATKLVQRSPKEERSRGWRRGMPVAGILAFVVAVFGETLAFVFGVIMLDDARGGWWVAGPILLGGLAVLVTVLLGFRRPLTDQGAAVRDHLRGLRLYIELAEADRIRVLQGPETAERRRAAADDPRERLHLYEELLPWAMVFGLEAQWAAVLGELYGDEAPGWYRGSQGFTPLAFAAGMSTLSSSTTSSFGSLGSSSGSGGSSFGGGGGSGGGGGGGGTGGV